MNITQKTDVGVPLTSKTGARGLSFRASPGTFVQLQAQNKGESGTLTCRVTIDGVIVAQNTSEGAYVIVSCSGTA